MTDRIQVPTRLLVHALVRADGTVDAGELYRVAETIGMSEQQVRLCVKRLVAEGRFRHEGRGRKAVLHASADTQRELAPNLDFLHHAYRQDTGLEPWDGRWHLAAFAVPESARPARDALRDTLLRLGGAALQGGLYVCANPWEPYLVAAASELGVPDSLTLLTSTDLRRGEVSDPVELARELWPQEELAEGYRRLSRVAEVRLARLGGGPSPDERLVIAVELAAELSRVMEPDPLLPPELLPQPWPGAQARDLFARCWTALGEETPSILFRQYAGISFPPAVPPR
ncbi:PaaX family transcriptional regulator C-terminal domain-containing protein [Crossiella sp. CA-258035]|uniref:PaaX family transcriptional regulator C-terminal domain-containing protein n=1 Tax=Crossiella sp. CA-258035 TaxID=2981138 RepID=UPI0024BC2944|nr:PaaX family transcriptional regulator C-terminal domain-containing protein [Crossiella sp. CA-258035]WHT19966.1 PaaX family transcriptional regulator C-terminal domain-containing protein [Crossiella sp. CA-258035]